VLLADLAPVELRHAPGYDERLSFALMCGELFDCRYRFSLALFDETAGVNNDGIGILGLDDGQEFTTSQDAFEMGAIDIVLRTAESDDVVGTRDCHY
jgi:hypothetical protein